MTIQGLMNIVLVAREFPPETAHGGIGTQTFAKAHGLVALGHKVTVISASVDQARHDRGDAGVRVIRIPTFDNRLPHYTEVSEWVTYSTLVASEINRFHEEAQIDVIEFPEWGCEGFVHLLNRSEWNFIPTVIQLHGPLVMFGKAIGWPEVNSQFFRMGTMIEGACLQMTDAIYSSSACSARWCAENYGLDFTAIPVIHTGVDTDQFSRPLDSTLRDRPTIVFVGRITGDKGAPLLVDAACRLLKEIPNLKLQLIGTGDPALISDLNKKAESAGANDLLEFTGFVDRASLPKYLHRATVFALPSEYEPGPGMVYLEAMSTGLPVIACEGAGAAEVAEHNVTGLLIKPGDLDGLVENLRRLLLDPSLRERLGTAGYAYVKEMAETRVCIERIENLYRNTISAVRSRHNISLANSAS
jgi:glycosyltransferase involved in cell wall biosynthesis